MGKVKVKGKSKGRGKKDAGSEDEGVPVELVRRDEIIDGRRSTFLSTDDEEDDEDVADDKELDAEEGADGYDSEPFDIEKDPGYIEFLKSGKTTEDVLREMREATIGEEDVPYDKEATHPGQLDLRVGEVIVAAKHIRDDEADRTVEYVGMGEYCDDLLLSSPLATRYESDIKELHGKKVVVVVNAKPLDDHWVKSETAMLLLTYHDTKILKPKTIEQIEAENQELNKDFENDDHSKGLTEEDLSSDKEHDRNVTPSEKEGFQNPSASEEVQESIPADKEGIQNEFAEKEGVEEPAEKEATEEPMPTNNKESVLQKSIFSDVEEVTVYEPIEVAPNSVPGSRVYVEGHPDEPYPFSDQQLYEYVLRGFRVDDEGKVFYRDNKPLLVEGPENGPPTQAFALSIRGAPILLA